jgi:DNA-binding NarL/FixJ family response regulator
MMTPAVLGSTRHSEESESPGVSPIRVVLIDPRPDRRAITALLVGSRKGLTVVGSVSDLAEAAVQIRAQQADLALLEIQMPVEHGLEVISFLREQFPALRIVVCSFHDDAQSRQAARLRGADGYLSKPLQLHQLLALAVAPRPAPDTPPGTSGPDGR